MQIERDNPYDLLSPFCKVQFLQLGEYLHESWKRNKTKTRFVAFEGFRHPARQRSLYQSGRNVTRADAFYSAHNYGLAVDFVPYSDSKGWSWDPEHDYDFLSRSAKKYGLWVPIAWDKVHVESPLWGGVRRALRLDDIPGTAEV